MEFANLVRVHRNTVSEWETGFMMPGCEILANFIKMLNANLNRLFLGKDGPFLDRQGSGNDPAAGQGGKDQGWWWNSRVESEKGEDLFLWKMFHKIKVCEWLFS